MQCSIARCNKQTKLSSTILSTRGCTVPLGVAADIREKTATAAPLACCQTGVVSRCRMWPHSASIIVATLHN